jgi:hypothetical protein
MEKIRCLDKEMVIEFLIVIGIIIIIIYVNSLIE